MRQIKSSRIFYGSLFFSLKNRSDAVIIAAEPANICTGYHSTASAGISIAKTEIAPAGGMYSFISLITAITSKRASAETAYKGNMPSFMQKTYLSPAPRTAQPVIKATAFTGKLRALEFGLENSVNATKSGGATANRKSRNSAGTIIAADKRSY